MIIDSTITKTRGAMAETGFKGEIAGIDYKIATIRKYMLAYLLNCNQSVLGMKVRAVYLAVVM